jgi:tRNA-2-methylthio-N6-dimethylallyladenosine synthase
MTDDLLQAVRDLPKASHYLHVPLQSGCDDVLKRMKRGYTVDIYRDMMQRIRETIPGHSVSSDFIVGFCGESEESFQKSMDAVREFRFKNSFIFKYSPREGTKAWDNMPDDIPEDVKRRRNNDLLNLQNEISEQDNAFFIGSDVEILVEGQSKSAIRHGDSAENIEHDITQLVGRTRCDRIVVFDGRPRLVGSFAKVHIYDCTSTTLMGAIATADVCHSHGDLVTLK